jgi:demethylmenaquinone methyltransferase/2-methoxy-6-polyprenyl-1,4-benzoquinol methylase
MSTYILMKILESAPSRYDRGIRMLALGRLDEAYDRLTGHIEAGQRVLDLGCGTGGLTLRAARKGAHVKGIDINPQMLEIAQKRATESGLSSKIDLNEMGVAELGDEESERYDVVMSGLCFSELTEDEFLYALSEVQRILKPGGLLLIADEVRPKTMSKRILNGMIRGPLLVITSLITQTTSRAIRNLLDKTKGVGLHIESVELSKMENFMELVGRKPE